MLRLLAATLSIVCAAAAHGAPLDAAALAAIPRTELASLDAAALAAEDAQRERDGLPVRYGVPARVAISPRKGGGWLDAGDGMRVWRHRVSAAAARGLSLGFTRFVVPEGATLTAASVDGVDVLGPFGARDVEAHGELWLPVLRGGDAIVELRAPADAVERVDVVLGVVVRAYRDFGGAVSEAVTRAKVARAPLPSPFRPALLAPAFGPAADARGHQPGAGPSPLLHRGGSKDACVDSAGAKVSGTCNMDVACLLPADPWREVTRATAVYSLGAGTICTGSLLNNTSNDKRMLFATLSSCGVDAASAPSLVAYWNYENSTCRQPGTPGAGGNGDGVLTQFNTGAIFVAADAATDFALVELDDPANPAHQLYWAGWDRTPYADPGGPGNGDHACSPGALCASVHHPDTDEKRIVFSEQNTTTTSFNSPAIPGDASHVHVYWDPSPVFPPNPALTIPPGATEPGSQGAPLYNAQRRFIGALHGGPSSCGATGENLSDYYGRFSVAAQVAAIRAAIDPIATNATTIDGRAECTVPAAPTGVSATATAPNQVQVSWNAVPGAASYDVLRRLGSCSESGYVPVLQGVTGTSAIDTTVSGGSTYSYRVVARNADSACASVQSACADVVATGACTLAPAFAGATGAASAGTPTCAVDVSWNAGTASCGTNVTYSLFRSTTPGFVPSPANRIAQCVTGTSALDVDVSSAQPYYYVVRAEDDTTSGSGACNSGNVDANTVEVSATPSGPRATQLSDMVESGPAGWTVSAPIPQADSGSPFAIVTTASHSPTRSWFTPNAIGVGDWRLSRTSPLTIGSGWELSFRHRYDLEPQFDGGVLEYSLDGTNWFDILAGNGGVIPANANRFVQGGYTGPLQIGTGTNPLGARAAWHGSNGAGFTLVRVDLSDFATRSVRFRYRFASDSTGARVGWWIDDVLITSPTACTTAPSDLLFANGFE